MRADELLWWEAQRVADGWVVTVSRQDLSAEAVLRRTHGWGRCWPEGPKGGAVERSSTNWSYSPSAAPWASVAAMALPSRGWPAPSAYWTGASRGRGQLDRGTR